MARGEGRERQLSEESAAEVVRYCGMCTGRGSWDEASDSRFGNELEFLRALELLGYLL